MKTVKDKYLVVGADFAGFPLKEATAALEKVPSDFSESFCSVGIGQS